jgi:Icc-related predicted phosphoesterase
VHVGSIAIKSFIEERQPLIILHGHIHESTRITGHWKELIGKTFAFNGSHDGPELAVVKFNPENPSDSKRILI